MNRETIFFIVFVLSGYIFYLKLKIKKLTSELKNVKIAATQPILEEILKEFFQIVKKEEDVPYVIQMARDQDWSTLKGTIKATPANKALVKSVINSINIMEAIKKGDLQDFKIRMGVLQYTLLSLKTKNLLANHIGANRKSSP